MKLINNSKTTGQYQAGGFTLIEMIGVLAVIAILAALLLPKVAGSISEAKVNNTAGSYQTMVTAATDHYGKYDSFNVVSNSTTVATATQLANWDTGVLMPEGLLDKPFSVKIGNGACIEVVTNGGNNGSGYLLDGINNGTKSIMSYVVEAVITNVTPQDAYDLSTTIDGATLTSTNVGSADTQGKVVYNPAVNNNVYMFITGR